ncbi:MAG: prolipoprotein diacylglyceryl transferase, partial [Bacilli bacterium]|nr:prolipoprotein diacylglyceryl transferase [Bacilli bacterium]
MNRVALDFGVIQIYWYSILIFLGITFGCAVVYKEAKKYKVNEDYLINLLFYGLIFGLLGARIYYVAFNLDYYLKYPIEILEIWNGGLAIHGGIIAGLLWIIIYTKKYKIPTLKMLDFITPGLILGQAIGRWGNFFNQEAHG